MGEYSHLLHSLQPPERWEDSGKGGHDADPTAERTGMDPFHAACENRISKHAPGMERLPVLDFGIGQRIKRSLAERRLT